MPLTRKIIGEDKMKDMVYQVTRRVPEIAAGAAGVPGLYETEGTVTIRDPISWMGSGSAIAATSMEYIAALNAIGKATSLAVVPRLGGRWLRKARI